MTPRFLPETLRAIAGDGTILPPPIYRPLIAVIGRNRANTSPAHAASPKSFRNPIRLLIYPDAILLLIFNGIIYAVFYAVTATISTLFHRAYPSLNEMKIGFCFLAIGGGMIIGSSVTGRFLDWDYQTIKNKMIKEVNANPEKCIAPDEVTKEEHFPIEKARLRIIPVYLGIFVACCMGYGWCIARKVNIAWPLLLHFVCTLACFHAITIPILTLGLVGYTAIAVLNTIQTLIVDLFPLQGSSITACVSGSSIQE
jgi:predicted MFS family arabinose efflux permease